MAPTAPSTRVSAVVLALGLGGAGAGACYSERLPPPTYRYACSSDGDCDDEEECRDGLCETPCTIATFEDDCGSGFAFCFNGACSNTCEVDGDVCPGSQECVSLAEFGIDLGGGGGSPFGGGSSSELGLCGRMCEGDGAGLCPEGEACFEGFCVATCDPAAAEDECAEGFVCVLGFCAPDTGEFPTTMDAGDMDAGTMDAGTMDAGDMDTGDTDTGGMDAGTVDAGTMGGGSGE